MARVFITGSSTGLGLMAGQLLIEQGRRVVLHGRNQARTDEAMASAPGAEAAVVGDLSRTRDMKSVADQVNRLGRFDAAIHNAGVGYPLLGLKRLPVRRRSRSSLPTARRAPFST
jgi:NAD(P)-dependent dehydrogenase (short-subunit alcohol dehydrogenase family)